MQCTIETTSLHCVKGFVDETIIDYTNLLFIKYMMWSLKMEFDNNFDFKGKDKQLHSAVSVRTCFQLMGFIRPSTRKVAVTWRLCFLGWL